MQAIFSLKTFIDHELAEIFTQRWVPYYHQNIMYTDFIYDSYSNDKYKSNTVLIYIKKILMLKIPTYIFKIVLFSKNTLSEKCLKFAISWANLLWNMLNCERYIL